MARGARDTETGAEVARLAHELARIADALERLGTSKPIASDWLASPAYVWIGSTARPVSEIAAPSLALLRGIDQQKAIVSENIGRLARGHSAHDMLLWGARGMGKSALVRAAVKEAQQAGGTGLALVQLRSDNLASLPALFFDLAATERQFLVFIDDLGFSEQDGDGPRHLRSALEGGLEVRPANVRLAVTSNRRAILARHMSEQDDPLNPRDAADDTLALADRFGLSLGFHSCTQATYLDIVAAYAEASRIEFDEADALAWARQRGSRSGRTAWQYVTELAGRSGRSLDW